MVVCFGRRFRVGMESNRVNVDPIPLCKNVKGKRVTKIGNAFESKV